MADEPCQPEEEFVIREKKWDLKSTSDWMAERAHTTKISSVPGDTIEYRPDEEKKRQDGHLKPSDVEFGKPPSFTFDQRPLAKVDGVATPALALSAGNMREQAEHLKAIEEHTKDIKKEESNISRDKRKLAEMTGADAEIARLEGCIEKSRKEIENLKEKIDQRGQNFWENKMKWTDPSYAENAKVVKECKEKITDLNANIPSREERNQIISLEQKAIDSQQKYLDNRMQDEGGIKKYAEFVKHSINNLEGNSKIDQYGRVIQALTYMDAKVFQISAMTHSKIVFVSGETLDLLINSELQIHPRAVDLLITNTECEKVMLLTQQRTADTLDEGDYRKKIEPVLKTYEMITRTETSVVKQQIESQYMPEGKLKTHLNSLTPAEAYRMRTVLRGAPQDSLQLAAKMAERYGDTSIDTLAAFVEIVKISDYLNKNSTAQPNDTQATRAMSIGDWSKFYEELRQKEIAGMIGDKIEQSVAESKAAANYEKRMKVKEAQQNYKKIKETNRNSSEYTVEVKAAMSELVKTTKDNAIKEKDYRQYQDETPQEWLERTTGTRSYIAELLDNGEAFNTKWAEITEEITKAEKWSLKEDLPFHSSVAAYYHLLKHGDDTRHYFNALHGESKGADQNADLYFKTMKKYIFDVTMRDNTVISQDAQKISTIYRDPNGYFGVTKCAYQVHLGREIGTPSVATHFPREQAQKVVKRQQATQNQQSNTNQ